MALRGASGEVATASWVLGSEFTPPGEVFVRLHQRMTDVHRAEPLDHIIVEEPLNLGPQAGNTTAETLIILTGLFTHALSWGAAMRVPVTPVNMSAWRRHFLGRVKRGTARGALKDMAKARCKALGIKVLTDDEADAVGILSWGCDSLGIGQGLFALA